MKQRERLISTARGYLHTPFLHTGRSRHGLDCLGLILVSAWDCGYLLPDVRDYSPQIDSHRLRAGLEQYADSCETPAPGDVLFLTVGEPLPTHLAFVSSVQDGLPATMIHAWASVGRVVEHSLNEKWLRRVSTIYRLR